MKTSRPDSTKMSWNTPIIFFKGNKFTTISQEEIAKRKKMFIPPPFRNPIYTEAGLKYLVEQKAKDPYANSPPPVFPKNTARNAAPTPNPVFPINTALIPTPIPVMNSLQDSNVTVPENMVLQQDPVMNSSNEEQRLAEAAAEFDNVPEIDIPNNDCQEMQSRLSPTPPPPFPSPPSSNDDDCQEISSSQYENVSQVGDYQVRENDTAENHNIHFSRNGYNIPQSETSSHSSDYQENSPYLKDVPEVYQNTKKVLEDTALNTEVCDSLFMRLYNNGHKAGVYPPTKWKVYPDCVHFTNYIPIYEANQGLIDFAEEHDDFKKLMIEKGLIQK